MMFQEVWGALDIWISSLSEPIVCPFQVLTQKGTLLPYYERKWTVKVLNVIALPLSPTQVFGQIIQYSQLHLSVILLQTVIWKFIQMLS